MEKGEGGGVRGNCGEMGEKRVESNGLVGEKGTRKDRKNERKTNRKKKANK